MPGRDLTSGMVTALELGTVRPVLLGRFDVLTDPLVAWTGYGTFAPTSTGDPVLDGQTFFSMAPFFDLTDIKEDQGIGGPTSITISGHDLDEELLRQIVRDKRQWRGRGAWLWLGLLNADEATVVTSPARIKTGVMTQMTTSRSGEDASVTVTIDQDLGRARGSLFRWLDHTRIYPTDTWSTFIVQLSNQPGGITDQTMRHDPDAPAPPGFEDR